MRGRRIPWLSGLAAVAVAGALGTAAVFGLPWSPRPAGKPAAHAAVAPTPGLRPGLETPTSPPPGSAGAVVAMQPDAAAGGWVIVASGADGRMRLYHSGDGRAWGQLLQWMGGEEPALRFFDSRAGVVLTRSAGPYGNFNALISTADGGAHWTTARLDDACLNASDIVGPGEVWCSGNGDPLLGTIVHTTDGGRHWMQVARIDSGHGFGPERKGGIGFATALRGFIGSSQRNAYAPLYSTRDGGRSWSAEVLPVPPGTQVGPAGYMQTELPHIFGSAGVLTASFQSFRPDQSWSAGTYAYRSQDGGSSWSSPLRIPRAPSALVDADHWWVAAGDLEKTSDGGGSFERVDIPLPGGYLVADAAVTSTGTIWVKSSRISPSPDLLFASADGGRTWTELHPPGVGT